MRPPRPPGRAVRSHLPLGATPRRARLRSPGRADPESLRESRIVRPPFFLVGGRCALLDPPAPLRAESRYRCATIRGQSVPAAALEPEKRSLPESGRSNRGDGG
jgi:hypothetical protein